MEQLYPYLLMVVVTIMMIYGAKQVSKNHSIAVIVGCIAWFLPNLYFVAEAIAIQQTTAPYDFLKQPMSDLGVTACGVYTYPLAAYPICSPFHMLINWSNILTSVSFVVGAICLRSIWPDTKSTRIATGLLIIFGLSNAFAGIVPADMHFLFHTGVSLPSMFVQIPALWLIAKAIRSTMPGISNWTYGCTMLTTLALLSLFLQPFLELPGGLLQRMLYASVYVWAAGVAITLWRNRKNLSK